MHSLIDCPHCAKLVLGDAPHCPFCGTRMGQGSTSAFGLGLGLTLVLGATTAACTTQKNEDTQGDATAGNTDTDPVTVGDTDAATEGTHGASHGTTSDSSTGNTSTGPDGDTSTGGTSTSTSDPTVSSDSWDSDAAAASYAGPDEQDSTDKV